MIRSRWDLTRVLIIVSAFFPILLLAEDPPPLPLPQPTPAIPFLQAAAAQHAVLAFAEFHRFREFHDFILEFLKDPATSGLIDQVIVEAGNSAYQDVIDRYVVGGEPIPKALLQHAWQDTTQLLVWDAPVYERLYDSLRELNRTLPKAKRIRLIAADPPIIWSRVRDKETYQTWLTKREAAFERLVTEAVSHQKKAIVIFGAAHVTRSLTELPNSITAVEKKFPGSTFVVLTHVGFGFFFDAPENDIFEPRVRSWPLNSIARVAGTALGAIPADLVNPDGMFGPSGPSTPDEGHLLQELGDAYLYLGNRNELTQSRPRPITYRNDEYWLELIRRYPLTRGRALDPNGPDFTADGRLIEPFKPAFPLPPSPMPPPTGFAQ